MTYCYVLINIFSLDGFRRLRQESPEYRSGCLRTPIRRLDINHSELNTDTPGYGTISN